MEIVVNMGLPNVPQNVLIRGILIVLLLAVVMVVISLVVRGQDMGNLVLGVDCQVIGIVLLFAWLERIVKKRSFFFSFTSSSYRTI